MADITDVVEKLIQLALHNPNREEAASAALKALALIEKHQIPIGVQPTILQSEKEWVPPSKDFMDVVEEMLKGRKETYSQQTRAAESYGHGVSYEQALSITDNETSTKEDAARQRLIDAWRVLREERKRLEGEVYRFEQQYAVRFWGVTCLSCGESVQKPWG